MSSLTLISDHDKKFLGIFGIRVRERMMYCLSYRASIGPNLAQVLKLAQKKRIASPSIRNVYDMAYPFFSLDLTTA